MRQLHLGQKTYFHVSLSLLNIKVQRCHCFYYSLPYKNFVKRFARPCCLDTQLQYDTLIILVWATAGQLRMPLSATDEYPFFVMPTLRTIPCQCFGMSHSYASDRPMPPLHGPMPTLRTIPCQRFGPSHANASRSHANASDCPMSTLQTVPCLRFGPSHANASDRQTVPCQCLALPQSETIQ